MDGDPRRNRAPGNEAEPASSAPAHPPVDASPAVTKPPTLNAAVRRRRSDRAFYLRLAGTIRQNERALERLKR